MTPEEISLRSVPSRWMVDSTLEQLESLVHPELRPYALLVPHRSLLFAGPAGCGKTSACVLALRRLFVTRQRPIVVGWVKAIDLSLAKRDFDGMAEARRLADRSKSVPVLVLDDMGQEEDWELLCGVVHHRADAKRITLASTGLTDEQLDEKYPSGFIRKFLEGGRHRGAMKRAPDDGWEAPWVIPPEKKPPPAPPAEPVLSQEESDRQLEDIKRLVSNIGRPMPKAPPLNPRHELPVEDDPPPAHAEEP